MNAAEDRFGSIREWSARGVLILLGLAALVALGATLRSAQWLFADGRGSVALLYVGIEIGAAIVFLGSLWFSHGLRSQIAVIALAVIVGVYAANAYIVFNPSGASAIDLEAVSRQRGHEFDGRSRFEVVADFRARGIEAVPHVTPPNFYRHDRATGEVRSTARIEGREFLPLAVGKADRRTVACNENGRWLVYDSDERGFRNPKGLWSGRPIDIALLGDSYGLGSCEDDGNDIAGPLRRRFPATLNLSASGGGGLSMLAYLNEYLIHLRPRHVFWLFFEGNDMQNIAEDTRMGLLRRYLEEPSFSLGLMDKQAQIDMAYDGLIEAFLAAGGRSAKSKQERGSSLMFLGPLRKALDMPPLTAQWTRADVEDLQFEPLEAALRRMKAGVEAWDGKLTLVYLPAWSRGRDQSKVRPLFETIHRNLHGIVERNDIAMIDLVPDFAAQPKPESLVSYPSSHYSHLGYKLVADRIVDRLTSLGERPSN